MSDANIPYAPMVTDMIVNGLGNMMEPGVVHVYGSRAQVVEYIAAAVDAAHADGRDPAMAMLTLPVWSGQHAKFKMDFTVFAGRIVCIGEDHETPTDHGAGDKAPSLVEGALEVGG